MRRHLVTNKIIFTPIRKKLATEGQLQASISLVLLRKRNRSLLQKSYVLHTRSYFYL